VRGLRDHLLTVVVGALFGYIVAATVGPLFGNAVSPQLGESAQARQYMLGLLSEDADALTALQPNQDVVSRALEVHSSQGARQVRPISLTYLGGGSEGRLQVHIYAVEISVGGQERFFPLALTLLNGKVVRTE
jgi:hypothetical protein